MLGKGQLLAMTLMINAVSAAPVLDVTQTFKHLLPLKLRLNLSVV